MIREKKEEVGRKLKETSSRESHRSRKALKEGNNRESAQLSLPGTPREKGV